MLVKQLLVKQLLVKQLAGCVLNKKKERIFQCFLSNLTVFGRIAMQIYNFFDSFSFIVLSFLFFYLWATFIWAKRGAVAPTRWAGES